MLTFQQVTGAAPHAKSTPPEILDYLSARGISVTLAAELQLKILKADALFTAAKGHAPIYPDNRYAIVFPHHSPLGFDIEWWSARLVSPSPPSPAKGLKLVHSFSEVTEEKTFGGKMFCPPNTPPACYLPHAPSLPKWDQIPKGSRIYIHESAIKAINGARLGTYSIGLNGVWGWSSRKHNIALLPELRDLDWRRLELQPVIVFDTNINTSQQVENAAARLAAKLMEITGRTTKLLRMSTSDDILAGADYGFDDYAVCVGDTAARAFLETPDEDLDDIDISELELMKLELSNEYCVLLGPGKVGRIRDAKVYSADTFASVVCATKTVLIETAAGALKEHNVPRMWMKDRRRTAVEDLTYAPGQDRICTVNDTKYLNRWSGWGCDPMPGAADPWIELMTNNIKDEFMVEWLLNWFAYPIQNPGKKLASYPLIFGAPGTGKDQLFVPLRAIYGGNYVKIGSKALVSNFNSVYAERQLVQADEIKSQHFTADDMNQIIKGIVTDETLTVNRKNQEEYVIPNTANLAITSNYVESVKLDEGDRRAGVINWNWEDAGGYNHRNDRVYWDKYFAWASPTKGGIGGPVIFDYLLNRDISKFDPNGWAPLTAEKADVIESGRSGLTAFVYNLKHDSDIMLGPLSGARQLYSAKSLLTIYYDGKDFTGSALSALTRELKNAGFRQANGGDPLRWAGGQERMWIIPRPGAPEIDFTVSSNCLAHLKAHPGEKNAKF